MREIKFRAWTTKGMIYYETISELGADMEHGISGIEELLQFTGLKDKNGKDIYEGDIINGFYYNNPKLFKVIWNNETCEYYEFSSYAKSEDGWGNQNEFKIMGNIYEHPHLLDNKD